MTFQTIACCTDFSPNADVAIKKAVKLSEKFGATLEIIHVVPPPVNPVVTDFDNPIFGTLTFDEAADRNMVHREARGCVGKLRRTARILLNVISDSPTSTPGTTPARNIRSTDCCARKA